MSKSAVHHVAVAVPSIRSALPLYEALEGAPATDPEELPEQGVRVVFVGGIELLEPLSPDTPVGRFLARRGPGIHHIAWRVPRIQEAIDTWIAQGYQAIDRTPRTGAGGHRVAFLHPAGTGGVLIELVEDPHGTEASGSP